MYAVNGSEISTALSFIEDLAAKRPVITGVADVLVYYSFSLLRDGLNSSPTEMLGFSIHFLLGVIAVLRSDFRAGTIVKAVVLLIPCLNGKGTPTWVRRRWG